MKTTKYVIAIRKVSSLILAMLCAITIMPTAWASAYTQDNDFLSIVESYQETYPTKNVEELEHAYRAVANTLYENEYFFDIPLEVFIERYKGQDIENYCQEYLQNYFQYSTSIHTPSALSSSSAIFAAWYYNTGNSLPKTPSYGTYSLKNNLRRGDIVVEHNTIFNGLTGHAAIVEGLFYNGQRGVYYIRVVEAIEQGVCRGVMDDERVDDKDAVFYRLYPADSEKAEEAAYFATTQLGKPYFLWPGTGAGYDQAQWYCSELVYAAYYNQKINIVSGKNIGDIVTPYDFERTSKLIGIRI